MARARCHPEVPGEVRMRLVLIALLAATLGCAGLIVNDDDSAAVKTAKIKNEPVELLVVRNPRTSFECSLCS